MPTRAAPPAAPWRSAATRARSPRGVAPAVRTRLANVVLTAALVRCAQADNCLEVLRAEDTPRYRLRYRLCALHLRAEVALVRGIPSRFCQARHAAALSLARAFGCRVPLLRLLRADARHDTACPFQKCSRFQPLCDFSGSRRTCSAALAKQRYSAHRASPPAAAAAAPTAPPAPSSGGNEASGGRASRSSPSLSEARGGGPSSGTGTPPSSTTPSLEAEAGGFSLQAVLAPFLRTSNGGGGTSYDLIAADGGFGVAYDDVAALDALVTSEACQLAALHAAHLKLPAAAPSALPDAFSAQLQAAWLQGAVAAGGLAALEAAVRPGCTLLHVDAMLLPGAPKPDSAISVAIALAADVEIGDFFAGGAPGGGAIVATAGRCAAVGGAGGELGCAAAPRLPALRPAALLASQGGALRFAATPRGLPASTVLRARLAGRMLSAPDGGGGDQDPSLFASATALLLPPLPAGVEGALLVDAFASDMADFPLAPAPRAALVCADAAIVAEVNAAAASADVSSDRGASADALEALLPALGRALRPGAESALLRGVASETMRRGWTATSQRVLAALAAAVAEEGVVYGAAAVAAPVGAATELHVAALYGSAADVKALLRCGAAAGGAAFAGPRGATPLHLAATRRDARGTAALAALRAAPGAAAAWSAQRDSWGLTPADVASRPAPVAAPSEREFVAWLSRASRSSVMAIAALQFLHFPTWIAMTLILGSAPATDAAGALARMHFLPRMLVESSTLYDVRTGAVVPLAAVPWPAVVAGTRFMVRYSLLARLPANAALLVASWAAAPSRPRAQAWYARHFELLYALCNAIEMLHMPIVEFVACYRALGLAVAYSPVFAVSYGLATFLLSPGFGRSGTFGPCRAVCNYPVLTLRICAFAGCLTWQRATWGAALHSPQLVAQMLMCMLSLANVAPNERRLRRLCATELAGAKSKREN